MRSTSSVSQSEVVADAPTLSAENAKAVGLVDHDGAVVLVLQLDNLGQLCQVAFHREDTIDNDELDGLVGQILEHALKVVHVVVLIVQLFGKRKTTTVHNRCMVSVVADDVVVLAYYHCQHALVDRETCREAETVVFADEL